MSAGQDVVIVVGERVIRTNRKSLGLLLACADQMLNNGEARDYYRNIESPARIRSTELLADEIKYAINAKG
jgi:hypothetical protein